MAETASGRIVTELHDEPHIEGRRVTVRRVQGLVEGAGTPPVEAAEELDLDLADVYAALHYYHTHPKEIEEVERRRDDRLQEAKDVGAKSLAEYNEDGGSDGASGAN